MASKSLIVQSKDTNTSSDKQPFDFLKSINDWLEAEPTRITNAFNNMSGKGATQEKVDATCKWLSWKVNVAIEYVRQKIIKALWQMYQYTVIGKVMSMITVIFNFIRNPLYYLGSFAGAIFAPYGQIIGWFKTLSQEIPRLANNLSRIASSLPPSSSNPNINFDAFKIQVKTITISDITSSPDNLPSPESMFPEPSKPFDKDTFDNVFTNVSANLKTNKLVYKLKSKDRQALLFSSDKGSSGTLA